MSRLAIEYLPVASLRPAARNARTHSKKQLDQLARSIVEHSFVNPILVDEHLGLIAGHGRLAAAKQIGLETVPVIILRGLNEIQKRTLMLADNKIAANSGWNRDLLACELGELIAIDDLDVSVTGFEPAEVDQILFDHEDSSADPADDHPETPAMPVSRRGDLWILGKHRLLCGDARSAADLEALCGSERASMAFLDPPYNVRVAGIVGRGKIKHAEFAMASGEMGREEFRAFLEESLNSAARFSRDGAVHFVCMDWRHIADLMVVGEQIYEQALNLIVWAKSTPGQGSFYRSQHELIGAFRVGSSPHLNNVELGRHGRTRTNVWHYAGVNTFGKGRLDDLRAHPTVKPVAMIADAIRDCTRRGDVVLDTFSGSGTTMLACERVGRKARSLELEPAYVDVAIKRWQRFTGSDAVHAGSGLVFEEMASRNDGEAL